MTESTPGEMVPARTPAMEIGAGVIRVDSTEVPLVVRRSNRARRLSIQVDPRAGSVRLVVPGRASEVAARRFLAESAGWVAARLAAMPPRIPFADGREIPLHGVAHRIRHRPGSVAANTGSQADLGRNTGPVWIENGEIHIRGRAEHLPRRLRDWLVAEARRTFAEGTPAMAAAIGREVRGIRIRDMRTRWASCGADGRLCFSWRLILAPRFVIEYMMAHEVAHLIHMNHGPRFWALVERLTSQTGAARRWLVREGATLHRYG